MEQNRQKVHLQHRKQIKMKNELYYLLVCTQMRLYFTLNWPQDKLCKKSKMVYFTRLFPPFSEGKSFFIHDIVFLQSERTKVSKFLWKVKSSSFQWPDEITPHVIGFLELTVLERCKNSYTVSFQKTKVHTKKYLTTIFPLWEYFEQHDNFGLHQLPSCLLSHCVWAS